MIEVRSDGGSVYVSLSFDVESDAGVRALQALHDVLYEAVDFDEDVEELHPDLAVVSDLVSGLQEALAEIP